MVAVGNVSVYAEHPGDDRSATWLVGRGPGDPESCFGLRLLGIGLVVTEPLLFVVLRWLSDASIALWAPFKVILVAFACCRNKAICSGNGHRDEQGLSKLLLAEHPYYRLPLG